MKYTHIKYSYNKKNVKIKQQEYKITKNLNILYITIYIILFIISIYIIIYY